MWILILYSVTYTIVMGSILVYKTLKKEDK